MEDGAEAARYGPELSAPGSNIEGSRKRERDDRGTRETENVLTDDPDSIPNLLRRMHT